MPIGVCILSCNSAPVIAGAVASALACPEPLVLLVLDNASSDGAPALVRARFPSVPVIELPRNLGYARGNNIGARWLLRRGCDYLAFVNPDVVLRPATLQQMRASLQADPRAGCAGGFWEGVGAVRSRKRPGFFAKLGWHKALIARFSGRRPRSPESAGPVHTVYGACILFPAAVFREIHGFDRRTFLYSEEAIVSERLARRGYHVLASPQAVYSHLGGASSPLNPASQRAAFIASEQILVRYYYHWPSPLPSLLHAARRLQYACARR